MTGRRLQASPGSWFPVYEDRLEAIEFRALTPVDKLFYWLLVSMYNEWGGGFYLADATAAATLGISVSKVRQTRPKLTAVGLITYKPGTKGKRGQGLATRYQFVAGAEVDMGSEGRYCRIHRFAFLALLAEVRRGCISHSDLATYLYLRVLCEPLLAGRRPFVVVGKRQLREVSGIPEAAGSVGRLWRNVRVENEARLFDIVDGYREFKIASFALLADPQDNEIARALADQWARDIKAKADALSMALQQRSAKQRAHRAAPVRPPAPTLVDIQRYRAQAK